MPYPSREVRQDGKDLYAEAERLGLKVRERDFALAYLEDPERNQSLAATKAGYKQPYLAGTRLIRRDKIKKFLVFAQSKDVQGVQRKLGSGAASRQETLRIMSEQMRGTLIDYLRDDGTLDIARLREDKKGYLLREWQVTKRTLRAPTGDEILDESVKGKPVDPGQAARLMAQHHRLIDQDQKPQVTHNYATIVAKLDPDSQEALRRGLGALYGSMLGSGVIDVEASEA